MAKRWTAKRTRKPAAIPSEQGDDDYRVGPACADARNMSKAKGDIRLTAKQTAFVREYLIDNNATEAVIRELALLGFSNVADYIEVTPDGDAYVDLSNLTQEQAAAVQEVTVDDHTEGRGDDARDVRRVRIKLHDKRAALVDLGNHLGLFKRDQAAGSQVVIIHDGRAPMSVTTSGDGGRGDD